MLLGRWGHLSGVALPCWQGPGLTTPSALQACPLPALRESPAFREPGRDSCPHCPRCQATRKQGLGRGEGMWRAGDLIAPRLPPCPSHPPTWPQPAGFSAWPARGHRACLIGLGWARQPWAEAGRSRECPVWAQVLLFLLLSPQAVLPRALELRVLPCCVEPSPRAVPRPWLPTGAFYPQLWLGAAGATRGHASGLWSATSHLGP